MKKILFFLIGILSLAGCEKYIYYIHTCHRISDADSIVRITPSFKIIPLERDDSVETIDSFHTDTLILAAYWYSYPPIYVENEGDTAIYEYRTYNNDCHDFPLEKIKYIGLTLLAASCEESSINCSFYLCSLTPQQSYGECARVIQTGRQTWMDQIEHIRLV